jgi:hypothetical protein
MRYWLYKCNLDGGPAGYWGDWLQMVFGKASSTQWGGHYSTLSPEVSRYLDEEVGTGDVVVAYQTNMRSIVGFCRISKITGGVGDRKLYLQPIYALNTPFQVHAAKAGTPLERSAAVNGPVMMRELDRTQMKSIIDLTRAPKGVLRGDLPTGGYTPRTRRT